MDDDTKTTATSASTESSSEEGGCSSCMHFHWTSDNSPYDGECRCMPPTAIKIGYTYIAQFPPVFGWGPVCGQYEVYESTSSSEEKPC